MKDDTIDVISHYLILDLANMVLDYCWAKEKEKKTPEERYGIPEEYIYGNYEKIYGNYEKIFYGENESTLCIRLHDACYGGYTNIISLVFNIIEKLTISSCDYWSSAIRGACYGGNLRTTVYLFDKHHQKKLIVGAINCKLDWEEIFKGACMGGNVQIFNLIVKKCSYICVKLRWDEGLKYACMTGHMEIVKLLIKLGATDWDWGIDAACKAGHMEIARLMYELYGRHCHGYIAKHCPYEKGDHSKMMNQKK